MSQQKYPFELEFLSPIPQNCLQYIALLEPQKILSEQLVQLNFHITSARDITSTILACTPDPSVWRDKMVNVSDTLNYIKQVTAGLHSSGYNYKVYMNDFFSYDTPTGSVQHGPPLKGKSQLSLQLSLFLHQKNRQLLKEQLLVCSKLHIHQFNNQCTNYDCYNVNIDLPVYNTFAHAAQAPPKDTCYCGLKLSGPTELAQHKAGNHKDGYSCSKCGKVFQNNRDTWKHFRSQHQYIYTYVPDGRLQIWGKEGYLW